jgi:hypothetical protein
MTVNFDDKTVFCADKDVHLRLGGYPQHTTLGEALRRWNEAEDVARWGAMIDSRDGSFSLSDGYQIGALVGRRPDLLPSAD